MAITPIREWDDKDILVVRGQTLATDGSGVARSSETPVVFVPGLLPGETGRVGVIRRRKKFWRAQLLEVLSGPGGEEGQGINGGEYICSRQRPQCLVFGRCGGCDLQHMSYEDTLYWKKRWVEETLRRIAKADVNAVSVKPVVGLEEPWRYRNKALLHWDGLRLGFYGVRSHEVVEFKDCLLLSTGMNEAVCRLKTYLREKGDRAGAEPLSVTIREDAAGKSVFLGVNIPHDSKPQTQPLNLDRAAYLTYPVGDLVLDVSTESFLQINTRQISTLVRAVAGMAGLKGDERVWDLYSGVGLLGLGLARDAGQVVGIEENTQGVRDAERNARRNGIGNSRFMAGKVEDILTSMDAAMALEPPDVVIVDPPRTGLSPVVIDKILGFQPVKILYVSCEPATLARDVGRLLGAGEGSGREIRSCYRITDVQPIDMFPWTSHVECVVLMSREYCE